MQVVEWLPDAIRQSRSAKNFFREENRTVPEFKGTNLGFKRDHGVRKGPSTRKSEPEFPNEVYLQWYRLYDIPVPERGKPWQFTFSRSITSAIRRLVVVEKY